MPNENGNSSLKRISKAFYSLKKTLISPNRPDTTVYDRKIDLALDNLSISSRNKSAYNYAETIRNTIAQTIDTSSLDLNQNTNLFQSPENLSRLGRYDNAEQIISNIPYCSRALNVLTDSIISPDNVSKASLNVSSESATDNIVSEQLSQIEQIINETKLESQLADIISTTLKYGDCFIEFCDFRSEEVPLTQSLYLVESKTNKRIKKFKENFNIKFEKKTIGKYNKVVSEEINKKVSLNIIENISTLDDLTPSKENLLHETNKDKKGKTVINLQDIKIIFHNSKKVVKLQSERYKVNLGYLIMPLNQNGSGQSMAGQFFSSTGSSGSIGGGGGIPITPISGMGTYDFSQSSGIDDIYKNLVGIIKKHINNNDIKINKTELKELLKRIISELQDDNEQAMNIRYIPPERMEHFSINDKNNFPYGEGIFEKALFSAKLLIALKTAATIKRVTDSSDKRIFYVEMGMPQNAQNMIESLKEALKRRKYSLNKFNDISSIPTMITTYEDFFIPQKNGKRYIEFDTMPRTTDVPGVVEELKFLRDEVISSIDVPSAFLNIDENVSNKALLAHESSLFAETILSYQKDLSKNVTGFVFKMYKYIYKSNPANDIVISFNPPKMLLIERETEHMNMIANLVETLERLGVPRNYSIKKFLTDIDWDEVEDSDIESKLDRRGKPGEQQAGQPGYEDQYGGTAMGGGGMGGF